MKDVKKYDKVMDHLKFFTFNSVLGTHYGLERCVLCHWFKNKYCMCIIFCYFNKVFRKVFNRYVSLRLRMQNAVPAQPCVEKLGISLILLNFLHCNFRLWFKTPQAFESYPFHASEMTRNTLNHCLKFALRSIFCHICYGKIF